MQRPHPATDVRLLSTVSPVRPCLPRQEEDPAKPVKAEERVRGRQAGRFKEFLHIGKNIFTTLSISCVQKKERSVPEEALDLNRDAGSAHKECSAAELRFSVLSCLKALLLNLIVCVCGGGGAVVPQC